MMAIKNYLPRSLLGRSLLIIVTPLCLAQVIAAFIFFEGHWDTVSRRLARNLAGDIAVLVDATASFASEPERDWVLRQGAYHMGIFASLKPGEVLPEGPDRLASSEEEELRRELSEQIYRPFRIDGRSLDKRLIIDIQMADGVLHLVTSRKRVSSFTTYAFVIWLVATSVIVLGIAIVFMRNQIKPILRLARAAEDFGKGRDAPRFKPEGAREVRQAAAAFIAMRERILRQINQRTAMLAGVSHDVRTPLTRMKLQLEMMGGDESVSALKEDVAEMEQMLHGYLAFARGQGAETSEPTDLAAILRDVVRLARRNGAVELESEDPMTVTVRPVAFRRIISNLVDNALRYADKVWVTAGRAAGAVEIVVDDDGPGIPPDERDEVFKPFYRIERSRNPVTGGIGLGLTIARDLARGHGGDIVLADSPHGGLRVHLRLPL